MMNQESVTTATRSMFLFHVLVASLLLICTVVDSQIIITTPAPIATSTTVPAAATLTPGAAPAPTTLGAPLTTLAPAAPTGVSTVGPAPPSELLSTAAPALSTAAPAPTSLLTAVPAPTSLSTSTLAPVALSPTFSDGVTTLQDCQWDLATSDINGDGIITQNEYPVFLDIFGQRFCNEPTGAAQCGAVCLATWFQLTAAIGTGTTIPITGLTSEQLLEVCSRTASSIPKSCPAPTYFPSPTNQPTTKPSTESGIPPPPVGGGPTLTTSAPGTVPGGAPFPFIPPFLPTISPLPPGVTAAPSLIVISEPVAPGVTAEDCQSDLVISDSDKNGVIDNIEYETFMALYGSRVCYTPTPETQTSRQIIYTRLLCATNLNNDCNAATGIPTQPPLLPAHLLTLVCTESYKLGMLSSTCTLPTTTTSSPGATPAPGAASYPPGAGATPAPGAGASYPPGAGATSAPGASYPPVVGGVPTTTTNGTTTTPVATIAPTIINNPTSTNGTAIPPPPPPPTNSPVVQVPSGPSYATRIVMTASSSRTGLLIIITAVAWLGL